MKRGRNRNLSGDTLAAEARRRRIQYFAAHGTVTKARMADGTMYAATALIQKKASRPAESFATLLGERNVSVMRTN